MSSALERASALGESAYWDEQSIALLEGALAEQVRSQRSPLRRSGREHARAAPRLWRSLTRACLPRLARTRARRPQLTSGKYLARANRGLLKLYSLFPARSNLDNIVLVLTKVRAAARRAHALARGPPAPPLPRGSGLRSTPARPSPPPPPRRP